MKCVKCGMVPSGEKSFGGHFKASGMRFLDGMMRNVFASRGIDGLDTVYEYYPDPSQ